MLMLDAAVRGGAVALLVLLAVFALRGARRSPVARYGAMFALGGAAYAVESAPQLASLDAAWLVPLRLASLGNPVVFWLYASARFDDDFAPAWWRSAAWLGTVGVGAWCVYGHRPVACLAFEAIAITLVGIAIWHALAGRAADLLEGRRRLRVVVVVAAALYTAAILLAQLFLHGGPTPSPFGIVSPIGLAAIAFGFAVAHLSIAGGPASSSLSTPDRSGEAEQDDGSSAAPQPADPREVLWLAALRRLMEDQKVYREEGLSIAALGGKLGIPEYRLRRLINQRLGHRNFSSYVNGYRLAEAMAALGDPSQIEVPIVTIALDAGFQSLGPFNRAFKVHTGMTPSEFRRRTLNQSTADAAGADRFPKSTT